MRFANLVALTVTCFLAGTSHQDDQILPTGTIFDDLQYRVNCLDMATIRLSNQEYFELADAVEMTAIEAVAVCEKYLLEEQRADKAECISISLGLKGVPQYRAEFLTQHTNRKTKAKKYRRYKLQVGVTGKRVKSSFILQRLPGTIPKTPMIEMPNGMLYNDILEGDGAAVRRGSTVRVDYVLSLLDGTVISNTHDAKSKTFLLEKAEFEGLAAGILGMRVNGKRKLVVPPSLGYDRAGYKSYIPPNATMILDVVLRSVE